MEEKEEVMRVRITSNGKVENYLKFVESVLKEKKKVVLYSSNGRTISKLIKIIEIIKQKNPFLYQRNEFTSECKEEEEKEEEEEDNQLEIDEGFKVEGEQEGGEENNSQSIRKIKRVKYISYMTITLSVSSEDIDTSPPGYQPPSPASSTVASTNTLSNDSSSRGRMNNRNTVKK